MDSVFIIALSNLKIISDLGRGDRIDNSTFITNNKETVTKLLNPNYLPVIGSLEANNITNADTVIYSKDKIPENLTPEQYLITKLYKVKAFEMAIWVMQDNSVNSEQGFLLYKKNGVATVSGNFIATVNCAATNESICLNLKRQELKLIRMFFRKKVFMEKYEYTLPTTQLIKGVSRISRAYYLIQSARGQHDLALKVALYCSVLETLFTTSITELSHQLAERVAYFLEEDGVSQYKTYKALKKAYSFRSKIIHGDVLKHNLLDNLRDTSLVCDDLIRRSLQKIFGRQYLMETFEGNSHELDDFFLGLLFHVPNETEP